MRILSYNIQAAINARSYLSYTWQWHRQILPGPAKRKTLARIAAYIRDFDLVCLQEIDLGGLRNGFLNHVEQLRDLSDLPYALAQTNRRLGKLSLHGNLILSKTPLREVLNQPLPSRIPGRGVLAAAVACDDGELVVANVHLSLGALDQHKQLRFIRNRLSAYPDVLITGDFNCTPDAPQLQILTRHGYRRLGDDPANWGQPYAALLGAHHALTALGRAAIGGKDSMSGSYHNLHVPPTLIAFAVGTVDVRHVISPEY